MGINVIPTTEERVILERLDLPGNLAATIRNPSFMLGADDARTVSAALGLEMARRGFDLDYEPNAEGVLIEDLIDKLFIP